MYYRLGPDGRTPIPVRDTEPGDWFEAMRRVDFTKFGDDDQSFVSTLFLSTDHNFSGKGPCALRLRQNPPLHA